MVLGCCVCVYFCEWLCVYVCVCVCGVCVCVCARGVCELCGWVAGCLGCVGGWVVWCCGGGGVCELCGWVVWCCVAGCCGGVYIPVFTVIQWIVILIESLHSVPFFLVHPDVLNDLSSLSK